MVKHSCPVTVIIPYFGRLPDYFEYFLLGCSWNPCIKVLLFTDQFITQKLPSSVEVRTFTLRDFSRLASRQLSIEVDLKRAYKVCDFRPAFGLIFSEYLTEAPFWGFGDLDVLWGNLSAFLAPLFATHDVMSMRKYWISGSLCVLRNCEAVNRAFEQNKDWRQVFVSEENCLFDELGTPPAYSDLLQGRDIHSLGIRIEGFTQTIKCLETKGILRSNFQDLVCEDLAWGETLVYSDGSLITKGSGEERMYLHYVVLKRRFFQVSPLKTQRFCVRKTGFYDPREPAAVRCVREASRVIRGAADMVWRVARRHISAN